MIQNSNKLSEGGVYRTLVSFAFPFLIANFIQAMYGGVDMVVVGWFCNAAGLSAVSTGSQVMQIVTSIISGLTLGGTILIGQFFGGGKDQEAKETVSTMLMLFAIAAALFTVVMLLSTGVLLQAMQTPPEAMEAARQYVLVCSVGIFFIFGYNGISAILRGYGDSKSPLIFISIACATNIVLDILFVGGLRLGPAGAAAATVIAQAVSLISAVWYLERKNFVFKFRLSSFHFYRDKAARLLRVGLPVSLQESTVCVSFLFITAIVNSLGVVPSAAVGICNKFESFAMLPATAFSGAISAIAAQNIGAGKLDRAKQSLIQSIGTALAFSLVFFLWAQAAPLSIMNLFRADPQVAKAGAEYFRSFSYDFILVCFGFILNSFLNGCGKTTFAMVNGILASLVIRLPLAYLLTRQNAGSLFGVGAAAPVATAVSVAVALIYIKKGKWKETAV